MTYSCLIYFSLLVPMCAFVFAHVHLTMFDDFVY